MNFESFEGRVAVVTGGSSGIGRGIATALAAAGARVVIASLEEAGGKAVAEELGGLAYVVDVTDADAVARFAERVIADAGRVDIVVNNAGVGPLAPFDDLSLQDLHWVMDINFWGVIHGLKAFLPHLTANPDGGWIVNTASVAALLPSPGITAYGASKAAMVAVSESLALELAEEGRVGVSVLLPALVTSNINANSRQRPGYREDGPQTEDFLPPIPAKDPREVGDLVVAGIRNGEKYIYTHPEVLGAVAAHQAEIIEPLTRAAR